PGPAAPVDRHRRHGRARRDQRLAPCPYRPPDASALLPRGAGVAPRWGRAFAGLFMALAMSLLDLHVADLAVAYAPGAQDTMMVLALALNLDPIFVGSQHLARLLVCSLTVP